MNRVLITGGAGYLGAVLTKKLLDRGYFVRVLDPLIFGQEPLKAVSVNGQFDLQVGLTEDNYILEKCLTNIDAVVHLSGLSNDPSCELNAELTKKVNIEATKNLLALCRKKGVKRIVNASSCSVYGFTEGKAVDESSELNPLTAYASSKVACEELMFNESSEDLVVTSLRKATLYGPSPRMRFDLVVNTFTGMALSEGKIIINGGQQWRPFVHVDDACEAHIFMLEADAKLINRQNFNVGDNEQNYKIIDLAYMIAEYLPNVKIDHSNSPDARSYRANFDKINNLGWKVKKNVQDGVLGIKEMFDKKEIVDFRDLNYFNIKRMISYLNV